MGELLLRGARPEDAEAIVRVHFAAVHGTAAAWYPEEVLQSWSGPVTAERIDRARRALSGREERCVVALQGAGVVGFGSIVPEQQELRSLYVDPGAGRRGVGSRILAALEEIAVSEGLPRLELEASLNAAPFYARHGFENVGRGTHRLRSGQEMACVQMRKLLPGRP